MPAGRARALLVMNPAAKGCRRVDLGAVDAALAAGGLDVEAILSGSPDVPARDARSRGFDRVVVAGGDGSLRSVLCATDLPVALLPLGTSNSVARSLRIPLDLRGAIDAAVRGRERAIDMGRASGEGVPGGSQVFMLCASAGMDAEIARRYERIRGGRWQGFTRWAVVAAGTAIGHRHVPFDVRCDGRAVARGVKMAVASNMPVYGGLFSFAPAARPDDGLLDLTAMRAEGPAGLMSTLARAFFALPQRPARARCLRARTMRWESEGRVLFQLDGEPVGRLPVDIEVLPGAARMLVPR